MMAPYLHFYKQNIYLKVTLTVSEQHIEAFIGRALIGCFFQETDQCVLSLGVLCAWSLARHYCDRSVQTELPVRGTDEKYCSSLLQEAQHNCPQKQSKARQDQEDLTQCFYFYLTKIPFVLLLPNIYSGLGSKLIGLIRIMFPLNVLFWMGTTFLNRGL